MEVFIEDVVDETSLGYSIVAYVQMVHKHNVYFVDLLKTPNRIVVP